MTKIWLVVVYSTVLAIFLLQLSEFLYTLGFSLWWAVTSAAVGIALCGFLIFMFDTED